MKATTDLDTLIRWLAGRGDPAGWAGDRGGPAPDSAPEMAQLLDQIRTRTRTIFAEPPPVAAVIPPAIPARPRTWATSGRLAAWVLGGSVGGLGLAAAAGWLGDRVLSARFEAQRSVVRAEVHAGADQLRREIARALARPAPAAVDPDWQRVEASLSEIEAKLTALGQNQNQGRPLAAEPPKLTRTPTAGDPAPAGQPAPIVTDLAALRQELASGEAATTRQLQEMRTVLHELNAVVRRVLNRPAPASTSNVALPLLAVAVQALINNLQHQTTQVRGEAVEQLGRLGPLARSALPALQQMLARESDPNIRSAIETAIGVISSN